MLVAVSGQVIAFSRGDIANFIMQIVAGLFAVLLIFFPIQIVFITAGFVMIEMIVLSLFINKRL